MSELNLEAIRRKAASPITATDKEWAAIVNSLLIKIEDLEDDLTETERDYERLIEYSDRQYYGTA